MTGRDIDSRWLPARDRIATSGDVSHHTGSLPEAPFRLPGPAAGSTAMKRFSPFHDHYPLELRKCVEARG